MNREARAEIRAIEPDRFGVCLGAARLLYGAAACLFAGLGLGPSGEEVDALQELLIAPGAWLGLGLALAYAYNGGASIFGGIKLHLKESMVLASPEQAEAAAEPTRVEWSYFDEGEKQQGPFEDQAFRGLIDRGAIGPDTKVSRAVRNLVTELILEDKTRPARDHPALAACLRSAGEGEGEDQVQDEA